MLLIICVPYSLIPLWSLTHTNHRYIHRMQPNVASRRSYPLPSMKCVILLHGKKTRRRRWNRCSRTLWLGLAWHVMLRCRRKVSIYIFDRIIWQLLLYKICLLLMSYGVLCVIKILCFLKGQELCGAQNENMPWDIQMCAVSSKDLFRISVMPTSP